MVYNHEFSTMSVSFLDSLKTTILEKTATASHSQVLVFKNHRPTLRLSPIVGPVAFLCREITTGLHIHPLVRMCRRCHSTLIPLLSSVVLLPQLHPRFRFPRCMRGLALLPFELLAFLDCQSLLACLRLCQTNINKCSYGLSAASVLV